MTHHQLLVQAFTIIGVTALFASALFLLSIYNRLFRGVRNLWLRKNLSTLLVALAVMLAILCLQLQDVFTKQTPKVIFDIVIKELIKLIIIVLFVFNVVWIVTRIPYVKSLSFI